MRHRDIVLITSLLGVIVVGMFTYTYLVKKSAPVETPTPTEELPADTYGISRIDAKHFYRDGVHTIVGELPMPTPCDLLTYSASVAESYPEQVTFDFDVVNTAEACAQVVTVQRFMVTATASADAILNARFMGQAVELNLVEAAANETPESFELFIKG
jgi:hypothetical protein